LEIFKFIIDVLLSGGWVMLPLFLLSSAIYYYGSEMIIFLNQFSSLKKTPLDLNKLIDEPSIASTQFREIIEYTQHNVLDIKDFRSRIKQIEKSTLESLKKKVVLLGTLVASAPLMGLLGTVIGMLGTFSGISMGAGNQTVSMVSTGISKALITTQTGLFIALPGTFLIMYIKRRISGIESTIEIIESKTITARNLK
jgi:biopolymer transport protein ExbB